MEILNFSAPCYNVPVTFTLDLMNIGRATLLLALALIAGMDAWLSTLRCSSSPAIDWSRLGFGLVVQLGVLAGCFLFVRRQGELGAGLAWKISVGLLAAAAFTFVLVREPFLLSDTITDKFYSSGGYACPGAPRFWRRSA